MTFCFQHVRVIGYYGTDVRAHAPGARLARFPGWPRRTSAGSNLPSFAHLQTGHRKARRPASRHVSHSLWLPSQTGSIINQTNCGLTTMCQKIFHAAKQFDTFVGILEDRSPMRRNRLQPLSHGTLRWMRTPGLHGTVSIDRAGFVPFVDVAAKKALPG